MAGSRAEGVRLLDDVEGVSLPAEGLAPVLVQMPRSEIVKMAGISLTRDVIFMIASYLTLRDIFALSATNYSLNKQINNPYWSKALYVKIPNAPSRISLVDFRDYLQDGFAGERTLARWEAAANCCEGFNRCTDVDCSWTLTCGGVSGFAIGGGTLLGVACTTDCMWYLSVGQRVGVTLGSMLGGFIGGGLAACSAFVCLHGVSGKCAECMREKGEAIEEHQKTDPQISKGYWIHRMFTNQRRALAVAKMYQAEQVPLKIKMT